MSLLKRYDTFQGSLEDGQSIMLPSDDGDWVRYEDVVALFAEPPMEPHPAITALLTELHKPNNGL